MKLLTLVINLEHAIDRRLSIEENFSPYPLLDIKILRAIDTTQSEVSDVEKYFHHKYEYRSLTKGEIACFKSHKKAAQELLDSGHEFALILEDDCIPNELFGESIEDVVEYCQNNDFDIINLASQKSVYHWKKHSLPNNEIIRYSFYPTSAAAMLISRKAAKEIVNMPIMASYDVQLQFGSITNLDLLHLKLPICLPDPVFESTIDNADVTRKNKSKNNRRGRSILLHALGRIRYVLYKKWMSFNNNVKTVGLFNSVYAVMINMYRLIPAKLFNKKY